MTALTGKVARIAVTAVTPTSSTDNAATLSSADDVTLSIDSTGKRHWVHNTTSLKLFEGASTANQKIGSVNYVEGIISLSTPGSTAATWTIDVETVTASYVGMGKAWTVNQTVDMRDHTSFSTSATDAQWRTVKPGLAGWTGTIERFAFLDPDSSTEVPGAAFFDRLIAGTETIVEFWTEFGTQNKLEGYAFVGSDGFAVAVDGDGSESVSLTGNGRLVLSTA